MSNKKSGFTLVEISIVLVIIGLLIGGILVGQSMIESTKINTVIREISTIEIQVGVFKEKFNSIPGDTNNPSFSGGGNGDGFIDFYSGVESYQAWTHLNNGVGTNYPLCTSTSNHHLYYSPCLSGYNPKCTKANWYYQVGCNIPPSKAWPQMGFALSTGAGIWTQQNYPNLFQGAIGSIQIGADSSDTGIPSLNGLILPTTALAFDSKMDDGNLSTGRFFGAGYWTNYGATIAPIWILF